MSERSEKPAVSIIMPCYNTEKYIKKAMCSIFAQTFKDYEIIMVDDGSSDSTPELLDAYEKEHPEIVENMRKEREADEQN